MVTKTAESLIREMAIGGKITLETVLLKAEERGIERKLVNEAIGRLASEGAIKIKKGVIEVIS